MTTTAPVPFERPEATLSATAAPRATSTARASRSQATVGYYTPTPAPGTATPKATPAAIAGASVAGCPLFPSDNAWRRDVSSDPVDRRSAAYIASIGSDVNVHPDFGSNPDYGIPFVVVPKTQARVPITFTEYGDESDPGPYPVPLDRARRGRRRPPRPRRAAGDVQALRALPRRAQRRRMERRLGGRVGPAVEQDASRRLDVRRRGRAPDPAGPRAPGRDRVRRDPSCAAFHRSGHAGRLRRSRAPSRIGRHRREAPADGPASAAEGVLRHLALHAARRA